MVVSGIGKSGHFGRKLASPLASPGTPAYFVHPAEASHGDLGMIQPDDVFIAISHSGESEELLRIVPLLKRQGAKLIALTGDHDSTLAREADIHLDAGVEQEACPLNLAPTASTTAALALGDALAVALLDARGFSADDFARSHPGGSLGRRLLTHVADVMRRGTDVPSVAHTASLREAVLEMLGRFNEDLNILQRAIRWGDGDTLFNLFTRTRAIRRGVVSAGQDSAEPNFGRNRTKPGEKKLVNTAASGIRPACC